MIFWVILLFSLGLLEFTVYFLCFFAFFCLGPFWRFFSHFVQGSGRQIEVPKRGERTAEKGVSLKFSVKKTN